MTWDIEEALLVIRSIQPKCMAAGYYIALAGGVLNKGYSDNDLDLVAMPRTKDSKASALIECLGDTFEFSDFAGYVESEGIYAYNYGVRRVEIAVVTRGDGG